METKTRKISDQLKKLTGNYNLVLNHFYSIRITNDDIQMQGDIKHLYFYMDRGLIFEKHIYLDSNNKTRIRYEYEKDGFTLIFM